MERRVIGISLRSRSGFPLHRLSRGREMKDEKDKSHRALRNLKLKFHRKMALQ